MIRDGVYEGQMLDDKWYVSLAEPRIKTAKPKDHLAEVAANTILKTYMPIKEFCKITAISEQKIVEMIRAGLYVGRFHDDEWYVSRAEVSGENSDKR